MNDPKLDRVFQYRLEAQEKRFESKKKNDIEHIIDKQAFQADPLQTVFDKVNLDIVELKGSIDEQINTIKMFENLANTAESLAKQRNGSNNKAENQGREISEVNLEKIGLSAEAEQLLMVAVSAGPDALLEVASWAKEKAKEFRNDEDFNKKIEKLQSLEQRSEALSGQIAKRDNAQVTREIENNIATKRFVTNSSEETYRMMLEQQQLATGQKAV